ncbi:MAG: Gfo/Idh/MocA family protein [Parashewanella sp.]
MAKLHWGFLGTSFISEVMANAISSEGRSDIIAVAGRNTQRLKNFADQFGVAQAYTDFDELIANPQVDIIYIALPNHLHHEYVIKAAKAGKAILCEKSLTVDNKQTQAIADVLAAHPVFFAEGLMYLNHPLIKEILAVLNSGTIGELKHIQASYSADIAQFVNPDSKGAIFNLGCYPASLAYRCAQLAKPDIDLAAFQLKAVGRAGNDGNVCETSATIIFRDELQVQLQCAEDYGLLSSFQLMGTKGYLRMETNPWLPTQHNQFSYGLYEQEPILKTCSDDKDAFYYQVKNIIDALETNKMTLEQPAADLQDSVNIMSWLTQWHDVAREM